MLPNISMEMLRVPQLLLVFSVYTVAICWLYKMSLDVLSSSESPIFSSVVSENWVTNIMVVGNSTCNDAKDLECRDKGLALNLKLGAICAILTAGALGIALPLLGRKIKCLKSDGVFFVVAKAFAAGVILATGFVHMIPHGMEALTSPCLPEVPFQKFPFAGFIALLAALGTLLVDALATEYYEKKQTGAPNNDTSNPPPQSSTPIEGDSLNNNNKEIETCVNGDHMHIVGIHAHAASHSHSHPHGHHSCDNNTHEHSHGQIGHSHVSPSREDKNSSTVRHLVISQVLELGIALHSVIIGISLGVSQSICTIRPLLAALSFHQFFEGFALGGCISQAGFKSLSSVLMALCFALTTPLGIGIGIGVASSYNAHSSQALVVEGVFDSISAGILIYMALVDLIAADFLSKRMCCNRQLQIMSYMALFLGAITMSLLAIWV